jgi:dTDP-4-amino-4,6-dideoxygalactose transaminase
MIVPFNELQTLHIPNRNQFVEVIDELLVSSEFILGKMVNEFEKLFCDFTGSKHAIGVANGSDALRIAISSKKFPRNSSILVAANTYFAAPAAIIHAGLRPIFFDVQIDTRFPLKNDINSSLTENTIGIIKSHLFGAADILTTSNLVEIHDCSQAHGTLIYGSHVGKGALSTYSFYPGKNLGAFGDAGLITTDSQEEYMELLAWRNQGTINDKYLHHIVGYNSRLDSIQAGILAIKIKSLAEENHQRVLIAKRYEQNLANQMGEIMLFKTPNSVKSTFHLFQIYLEEKDITEIQNQLMKRGISTGRHYPIPLHLQPAFKFLGYGSGDFPNSEKLAKFSLTLPCFPSMTNSQVDYVCENLLKILNK